MCLGCDSFKTCEVCDRTLCNYCNFGDCRKCKSLRCEDCDWDLRHQPNIKEYLVCDCCCVRYCSDCRDKSDESLIGYCDNCQQNICKDCIDCDLCGESCFKES